MELLLDLKLSLEVELLFEVELYTCVFKTHYFNKDTSLKITGSKSKTEY